ASCMTTDIALLCCAPADRPGSGVIIVLGESWITIASCMTTDIALLCCAPADRPGSGVIIVLGESWIT
ncbi:hypothetical protein G7B21_29495, partial [Klebsiella pneumoniae]|nr:hypothetical protein [Klebsiella pneumoniae]